MSTIIWFLVAVVSLSTTANAFDLLGVLKENNDVNLRDVSEVCRMQMSSTLTGLSNSEAWAWSMIDASTKIPNGILYGNILDFGNYDQCIAIEHQSDDTVIRGKFCAMSVVVPLDVLTNQYNKTVVHFPQQKTALPPPKFNSRVELNMGLVLSICIPNACTPMEVQEYLDLPNLIVNDDYCQTRDKRKLDGGDIAVTTFLAIILLFMVASTIYDIYLHKTNQKSFHPIFMVFSVLSNGRKLLTVTNNDNQLNCLNGIRFISMTWIVVGHRFALYAAMPVTNAVDAVAWRNSLYSQYIQAAPVAVDTFFFLSGMMISYGYFKTINKPKPLSFVPMLYLHRILRITPALAVLYLVSISIFRHLGSGPLWPSTSLTLREPCVKWWWSFFLYVQNYVNYDNVCIPTTWYLSTDMQLFLLSPFIVMPLGYIALRKTKIVVYIISGVLIAQLTLIPFAVHFFIESKNEYMTQDRLAVWMVGITAGILIEEVKTKKVKVHINWMLNISIWIAVLSGMIAMLLTMHDVRSNPDSTKTNAFDTFHRLGWGVGLTWIVYSCTIGYGGFINSFLSYQPFQVLTRMCYCMYLTHMLVIFHSVYQMRSLSYFSDYHLYYLWCGDYITTMLVSLVWVLAFESPMIILEKIIFGGHKASTSEQKANVIHVDTKSPEV